jgi:glyoxylase-like metal-dependent hydrolase (beta-lactamase superfamily II)
MIDAVKAFEGGYCRQLLAMIDRRSLRLVKFQAVFFAIHHRREGWILVDTGYGTRFQAATQRFPYRFYRWVTPATAKGSTSDQLKAAGIDPAEIRHVVVTHFHADHIGGLAEFPGATIHFHADALHPLRALSPLRQVRSAFLPELVPDWLEDRSAPVSERAFTLASDLPFPVHHLFDDGSLRLVSLPGHGPGQLGLAFCTREKSLLYVADAYWRRCQVIDGVDPLAIALAVQWDTAAYRETVARLRELHVRGGWVIVACHDDGSASLLNGLVRTGEPASNLSASGPT